MDAGTGLFNGADGSTIFESANHPFDAYFGQGDTSALQPICAALHSLHFGRPID